MLQTNIGHAKKIETAINKLFGKENGTMTNIVDTLADLRHLCDLKKLEFAELDRLAQDHYAVELAGEE